MITPTIGIQATMSCVFLNNQSPDLLFHSSVTSSSASSEFGLPFTAMILCRRISTSSPSTSPSTSQPTQSPSKSPTYRKPTPQVENINMSTGMVIIIYTIYIVSIHRSKQISYPRTIAISITQAFVFTFVSMFLLHIYLYIYRGFHHFLCESHFNRFIVFPTNIFLVIIMNH